MTTPTAAASVAICKQILCSIHVAKILAKNFEILTDHVEQVLDEEGNEDADIIVKRQAIAHWFDYLIGLRDECKLILTGRSLRKYQVNASYYKCAKNFLPNGKEYFYLASEDGYKKQLKGHLNKVRSSVSCAESNIDGLFDLFS